MDFACIIFPVFKTNFHFVGIFCLFILFIYFIYLFDFIYFIFIYLFIIFINFWLKTLKTNSNKPIRSNINYNLKTNHNHKNSLITMYRHVTSSTLYMCSENYEDASAYFWAQLNFDEFWRKLEDCSIANLHEKSGNSDQTCYICFRQIEVLTIA